MLADLDLTDQRSAQLRPIYVPYIRVFSFFGVGWGRKTVTIMPKSLSVGLCCSGSANSNAHPLRSGRNRNRTPNCNIISQQLHTTIVFPDKEPGCGVASSHREGSVQLLLFLAASVYVQGSHSFTDKKSRTFPGLSRTP